MKTILAELNQVINSLENQGFSKEASDLNSVFMKIAQTDIDEQSPVPPAAPMAKPKPTTKSDISELKEILVLLKSIETRVAEFIKERSIFDE